MEYYFRTEQMTVGYQGRALISDIEISIEKGQILTLIGPNGAGKTTILKSIARQLSLIHGSIFLEQQSVGDMPSKELAKKMAVVLTGQAKSELLTCEDVVAMGRYPYTGRFGFLSKMDRDIVEAAMERTRCTAVRERDFSRISDGQRQRVMLARAICQEPEILILDEPASFLDIGYKLEFMSVLQEMARKEGLTIIMSLHELDLAERVSDRLVCIKGNHIDRVGTPKEIFCDGYISRLYDIENGSFDDSSGRVELPKSQGRPQCFVLAGGGGAAGFYRALQRKGIPFSTGILHKNDVDYPVALALAETVIAEKAFSKISPEQLENARTEIEACQKVYCVVREFGEMNQEVMELAAYAKKLGRLGCLAEDGL